MMSLLSISEPHYYLRSSDKHTVTSSQISPSPTTPPMDIINNNTNSTTNTTNTNSCTTNRRKLRPRNRRKRRFSQINNTANSDTNDNQDIDLHANTTTNTNNSTHSNHRSNKKAKLSRTIKFTLQHKTDVTNTIAASATPTNNTNKIKRIRLTFKNNPKNNNNNNNNNKLLTTNKQNLEAVISREASLSANSPIITSGKTRSRHRYPCIEQYEIPISNRSHTSQRNPYICCYEFFNGYRIGITSTLGAGKDLKDAIKILSQELVSGRAKASLQTQKNACLVYLKTRKNKLIGCGILHIDHVWKRVNIEMFAIDVNWRGNGFASMMVYLIQYRMLFYHRYDLFVCAANDAVPFWSNKKYHFVYAHKGILEQHEVEDEKHGGTRHLIWYGTPIQARCALLKCFKQTE